MITSLRLIAACCIFLPFVGNSAEISRISDGFIRLQGEIVPGDADRLEAILYESALAFVQTGVMEVDSPGGDIGEAMRIARIVEDSRIAVTVEEHAHCASACFLIVASASVRFLAGTVAVHRPYLPQPAHEDASISFIADAQTQAARLALAFLRERSVPHALLDHMVSTPSSRAYVLRFTDLKAIGMFLPAWEEVLIARCSLSSEDAISGDASDEQWSCAKRIATDARLELVSRNYSPEVAREIMRRMLLDAGGIEVRGGAITFDLPADSVQEEATPRWDSFEPVEDIPALDSMWDEYVARAQAKDIQVEDPKDSVMRFNALYNDVLPRLARRGDAEANFRLGVIDEGFFGRKAAALAHFKNASELGMPIALLFLGMTYEVGNDEVDVDKPRALAYYFLAERNGVDRATELRTRLESELNPAEVQRAHNLEAMIGSTLPVRKNE